MNQLDQIRQIFDFRFIKDSKERAKRLSLYDQDLVKEVQIERIAYNQSQEMENIPEEYLL